VGGATGKLTVNNISIPRYCFHGGAVPKSNDEVVYQLQGICDASDNALSCVLYLRRLVNGHAQVSFIQGKTKVVLAIQSG